MTNKEKYLKSSVNSDDLSQEILNYFEEKQGNYYEWLPLFWVDKAKINISEEEKTILKKIPNDRYNRIGRKFGGALYLGDAFDDMIDSGFDDFFENVFEFINEGDEYKISDLLGDD